jgi:hypothetical protein
MRTPIFSFVAWLALIGACGSESPPAADDPDGGEGTGGQGGGGKTPPAKSGGKGGHDGTATGGSPGAGGTPAAGGSPGAGGTPAAGGAGGDISGSDAAVVGDDAGGGETPDAGSIVAPDGGGTTPAGVLPGSTLIFDGKTLDGWDGAAGIWSVKDGAIDGLTQNGGQLIVTKQLYDTFRISGQARMPQSTNHLGVCFWGAKAGHGYGGCIDFVPPSGSIWDYGGGGDIRTLPYVYMGKPVLKTDWHQFEILANAQTGTVRMGVDGHEFPVYHKAGRGKMAVIGLQIHAGFSEVQYKDLAVEVNPKEDRLLSVTAAPLPAP